MSVQTNSLTANRQQLAASTARGRGETRPAPVLRRVWTEGLSCDRQLKSSIRMSADSELNTDATEDSKLVRPKVEFQSLLQHAGATKDVFTMKEVMFYLGQYIIQKQLYDQSQQHIVHCSHDALGQVLGVDSFSVKEPRVLFAMITKNLVAVKNQDSPSSFAGQNSQTDRGTEEADSESRSSSPERRKRRRRRRRSRRSSDPGPSHSTEATVEEEDEEEEEEEEEEVRKRRRSDSYSFTFDNSLSWCVIGGLGGGRDRHSSQSSDAHSTSGKSEVSVAASELDSDNFSVEFEVESIDSDDYDDDDTSLSGEDQVYEVTIFEADDDDDDDDSSDEDTEITEADYWRCVKCEELNPPLPRNCNRCWALRQDWLPEVSISKTNPAPNSPKDLPPKPTDQSPDREDPGSGGEENEAEENDGVDVPDGKRAKTPLSLLPPPSSSQDPLPLSSTAELLPASQPLPSSCSSQEKLLSPDSLPSSWSSISSSSKGDSQELLPSSPSPAPSPSVPPGPAVVAAAAAAAAVVVPELERSSSAEWRLPESCLDPCVICQSRPKNGCIVHGRTGHLMSCYVCARKLKRRNKLCPVCRLPIQSVVLTYFS
ncbi:E3 ubiquitin-protein ligase Mdm2 [Myripristis murdjan]|uniref:MDM2 proto-onco n=1 Tax=Myripristis murdjan TaxID=586833 RepID=A0A667XI37_9TELE|nr:E3 ubiquitin-protein ligase Mdm2 [Myripristis murdjan]